MRRYGFIAVITICIVTAGFLVYRHLARQAPTPGPMTEQGLGRIIPAAGKAEVYLYFSDTDHSHLRAESRVLVLPGSTVDRAKTMVHALIKGPSGSLTRTLPGETALLALYLTEEGVAYVDFNKAVSDNHPGGSLTELLSIYSVVNTLSLNIPEIEAVKFLIEGREAKTLAGHIDLRYPFRADLLMIK